MLDIDVGGGTPGSRLHGNPMYSGRAVSIFTLSLAAVTVGAAYNMLDEYERLMRERKTPLPPFIPRIKGPGLSALVRARADPHRHRGGGRAQHRRASHGAVPAQRRGRDPYTFGDDMLLAGIAREAMLMCWRVIDDDLWQTVGASVARDGERTARVFRDMAVAAAHRNLQLRDMFYGDIGRAALGEPQRVPGSLIFWASHGIRLRDGVPGDHF